MRDVEQGVGRPKRNILGGPLTKGMVKAILAMCENKLMVSQAANDLGVTNWTISRQLGYVEDRTGLNCRDFFDAVELYNLCWDEYPHLIAEIAEERFVGRRVPMKYTH